jgi:hypothetical protein
MVEPSVEASLPTRIEVQLSWAESAQNSLALFCPGGQHQGG